MSEYMRNVAYLYEYDEKTREVGKGCGFVRTMIREEQGKITVVLQDAMEDEMKSSYLGFYVMGEDGVQICCKNPVHFAGGSTQLTFYPKDVEGFAWEKLDGMVLKTEKRIYFGAWKQELSMEHVRWVESFKEILATPVKEVVEIQEIPAFLKPQKKEKKSGIKYDDSYYIKIVDWKDLFRKKDQVEPFPDDEIYSCIEIGPEEIKYLPSSCNNALKNSFLLHGLYYYNHVLVGKYRCKRRQKIYVLGIPGSYDNGERVMAAMFGFDKFKAARREGVRTPDFGYWYSFFKDDEE